MLEPYYRNEVVTLYHGDCLDVMPQLTEKFDCCITDPPYGTTRCKWDSVIPLEPMWENLNRMVKDNGAVCLFGLEPFTSTLILSNLNNFKYRFVWLKSQISGFLNAKKQPLRNVEDISVFYLKQCIYNPQMRIGKKIKKATGSKSENYGKYICKPHYSEEYYPTLTLDFPHQRFKNGHPTQKPVPLIEYLVKTYTNENELVLDFTCGSGTTGVACMRTNRRCVLIEQDEKYCEVTTRRLEEEVESMGLFLH